MIASLAPNILAILALFDILHKKIFAVLIMVKNTYKTKQTHKRVFRYLI